MHNISVIEYESESKELRSNLWTFCIYPDDSLPDNYLTIINSWVIPVLLSPVHDSDVNGNGMEKKKHIHVMMHFGARANKSYDQVMKFVDQLHGCPAEVVHNSVGMIRYFVHRDNPEKYQYQVEDMTSFFGFQYLEAFNSISDEDQLYKRVEDIILENKIFNAKILTLYLKKHNLIDELRFARRHTIWFKAIMDGIYHDAIRSIEKNSKLDDVLSD